MIMATCTCENPETDGEGTCLECGLQVPPMAAKAKTFGVYHLVRADGKAGCGGKIISGSRVLARQVEDACRCSASGCRGNWPTYRAAGDNRLWRPEEAQIDERQLRRRAPRKRTSAVRPAAVTLTIPHRFKEIVRQQLALKALEYAEALRKPEAPEGARRAWLEQFEWLDDAQKQLK